MEEAAEGEGEIVSWEAATTGVLGIGVGLLGLWAWRHAERVASFFQGMSSPVLGDRGSRRVYTPRLARIAAVYLVVFGSLFVVFSVLATLSGA